MKKVPDDVLMSNQANADAIRDKNGPEIRVAY